MNETARTRARSQRHKPTDAERVLWALLRDRRLSQTKWRRQAPMGDYIVDFVCLEHRLVIACDGSQNAGGGLDGWLASENFRVLRLRSRDVLRARQDVIDTILAHCRPTS